MRRLSVRRRIALWLTLAAMLFSALSPAMASTLFAQRADILARVLGLPAQSAAEFQLQICHQDPADIAAGKQGVPQQNDTSQHDGHGVFCSFCLAASAIVAVPAAAATSLKFVRVGGEIALPRRIVPPPLAPVSTQRSRAPPSLV